VWEQLATKRAMEAQQKATPMRSRSSDSVRASLAPPVARAADSVLQAPQGAPRMRGFARRIATTHSFH